MKLMIELRQTDDGEYCAACRTLPGCETRGPTPQEATDRIDEAIRGYIASLNNFVPERLETVVTER